jgi:hypothetical protein
VTATLERRIARLEIAQGNADVMVEHELRDEGRQLLREVLTGLYPRDRIEEMVSTKMLGPREISPAAKRQIEDTLAALPASAVATA